MARRHRGSAAAKAPAPRRSWLDRSIGWLAPGVVVATTFLLFFPALQGQFLTWDDDRNFLMNEAYRGLGLEQLRWMWTTFHLGPYQPLSWMTLGFDYTMWGMDPWGYHLTNLILHTANAWLVYLLALNLLAGSEDPASVRRDPASVRGAAVAAAVAALLFAIHPLRVESVAWVTERRDVLSGFFAVLTMIAYLRAADLRSAGRHAGRWLAAAIVLFTLSLLAKATAMLLPAALIVIHLWWLRRTALRALLVEKIPFAVAGLAAIVLTAIGQKTADTIATMDRQGPIQRLARAFYGLMFYVWKSVVPVDLSNLYEVPFRANAFDWHFLLSAALVIAITVGTFLVRRRWPALFVVWATYAVLMLPASGVAHPGGQIVADRYSYIPCIALALLAGAGVRWVWLAAREGRLPVLQARLVAAGVLASLVALAVLTTPQIRIWHDSPALWRHALALHPIERLRRAGPAKDAERRALETTIGRLGNLSAYWAICYNFGTTLRTEARHAEAEEVFARGSAVNPDNADLHNSRAASLTDLRRFDEAVTELQAAIRLEPGYAKAYYNLGIARAAQGRPADAIAAYREAIRLDAGSAEAHYNLGVILADAGQVEEAAAEYTRAVAIKPDYAEAHNNLGVALGRQGRVREAIDAFRRSLAINPDNPSAQRNLAQALEILKGRS